MRLHPIGIRLLAVAAVLLMPFGADAAGLGRLIVHSYLGQPLNGEIELVSIQKNETITARVAPAEVYTRANSNYDPVLGTARVIVQNRPNGEPYLHISTGRPLNEPFLELIIELNSQHGRVTRQYTALLDPPGYGTATRELPPPVSPPVAAVTPPRTAAPPAGPATAAPVTPSPPPAGSALEAPPASKPGVAPAPREPAAARPGRRGRAPAAASPPPGAQNQYGPIQRGETLGRIARSVKPEGVTLEQTLVGLYRENPDAFIRNNMNLVKSGKILRVPDATALSVVAQPEAAKEVRMQAADFNSYRGRLAEKTGIAREEGTVTKGKIGARVADGAAPESPRDTVRVSRGEPGGAKGKGAPRTAQERVRALEEEAIAREKALAEANDRIEKLEKTIKESQKLAELKSGGMAAAQQAAEKAKAQPAPAKKDEPAKKEDPAKKGDTAKKAEPAVVATAPAQPALAAKALDTATKGAAPVPAPTPAPDDPKKAEAPKPPAPKAKAAPPPPPEPDFIEMVMNEPLYQAGLAGAVIALGALGMYAVRRRREQRGDDLVKIAPTLGRSEDKPKTTAAAPAPSEPTGAGAAFAAGAAAAGAAATAATPKSPPPQRVQTPRTDEAKPAPQPAPAQPPTAAPADDNDLDFGASPARAAPQPPPPPPAPEPPPMARAPEPPTPSPPAREQETPEPMLPDFELDTSASARTPPAPQPLDSNLMDFTLDPLPPVGSPESAASAPSGTFSTDGPPALDFDLKGLDLDLGKQPQTPTPSGPPRDEHWYDVQQKFDLAKAYEEMGDKDGAREILKEVLKEGDAEQQAQAQKLLGPLS